MNKALHENVVHIWKEFCSLHNDLFEATCIEYQLLLESKIDELDEHLKTKVDIIGKIKDLESSRQIVIQNLNKHLSSSEQIDSVSDLIRYMKSDAVSANLQTYLEKYNLLLMDIIEKIQDQNKKNQVFLNRAILSLRSIREGMSGGKKKVSTYNSQGKEMRRSRV